MGLYFQIRRFQCLMAEIVQEIKILSDCSLTVALYFRLCNTKKNICRVTETFNTFSHTLFNLAQMRNPYVSKNLYSAIDAFLLYTFMRCAQTCCFLYSTVRGDRIQAVPGSESQRPREGATAKKKRKCCQNDTHRCSRN